MPSWKVESSFNGTHAGVKINISPVDKPTGYRKYKRHNILRCWKYGIDAKFSISMSWSFASNVCCIFNVIQFRIPYNIEYKFDSTFMSHNLLIRRFPLSAVCFCSYVFKNINQIYLTQQNVNSPKYSFRKKLLSKLKHNFSRRKKKISRRKGMITIASVS